jgi:pyrroloquinoline quinone biosynthesis protein B
VGCQRARAGDSAAQPRTQAGLAVSGDGEHWYLLNASPDLREQIGRSSFLHPRPADGAQRHSPIAGVILTNADVDAIAGLLTLRERQPFTVYATDRVQAVLDANPVFEVLSREVVARQTVALGERVPLKGGLTLELFAAPGKTPLYLETDDAPAITLDGVTTAASLSDDSGAVLFIPSCAAMIPDLKARIAAARVVFFDATLWRDDEMIVQGAGVKTGRRMGHMSLSGPEGTLAAFADIEGPRKILIHINNTNPVLLDDTPERAEVERAGWTVAFDGQEIVT